MGFPQVENGFGEPLHAYLSGEALDIETGVHDAWDEACPQATGHNVPVHVTLPAGEQGNGVAGGCL